MIIDSHQHFWKYNTEEFGWIPKDVIRRSFETQDLEQLANNSAVKQVVSVQARCSLEENDYLLGGWKSSDLVTGVVGWVDLSADSVEEHIEEYASTEGFKGVREIIQGQPDESFLRNPAFIAGVNKLPSHGLTYDLLVFADQLVSATSFVDQCESVPMVLDHGGKPDINTNVYPQEWGKSIKELALRENLSCKLSGLVTEIRDGSEVSASLIEPYFNTLLEAFGPDRLMFGSDWPVCLLEAEYERWLDVVSQLIGELSDTEQQAIYAHTAKKFYSL